MLFDWAMRWELIPHDRNHMSLVRVKGCSKRTRLPKILTIEEFNRLLETLKEPYRTMALVALFLGPRVSEQTNVKFCNGPNDGSRSRVVFDDHLGARAHAGHHQGGGICSGVWLFQWCRGP